MKGTKNAASGIGKLLRNPNPQPHDGERSTIRGGCADTLSSALDKFESVVDSLRLRRVAEILDE